MTRFSPTGAAWGTGRGEGGVDTRLTQNLARAKCRMGVKSCARKDNPRYSPLASNLPRGSSSFVENGRVVKSTGIQNPDVVSR